MKKILYGLLVVTSVTGSVINASEATARQKFLDALKAKCPADLDMEQLEKLNSNEGTLEVGDLNFKLHTVKSPSSNDKMVDTAKKFKDMLPSKLQPASRKLSVAHIATDQGDRGRATIPELRGDILKCTYTFRTAFKANFKGGHKTFAIVSDPINESSSTGFVEGVAEHLATHQD